jgi:hypothetical protein
MTLLRTAYLIQCPSIVPSDDLIKYLFPNSTSCQLGLLLCSRKELDKPVGSLGLL